MEYSNEPQGELEQEVNISQGLLRKIPDGLRNLSNKVMDFYKEGYNNPKKHRIGLTGITIGELGALGFGFMTGNFIPAVVWGATGFYLYHSNLYYSSK